MFDAGLLDDLDHDLDHRGTCPGPALRGAGGGASRAAGQHRGEGQPDVGAGPAGAEQSAVHGGGRQWRRRLSLLRGPDLGGPVYQVRGCVKEGGWERWRREGGGRGGEGGRVVRVISLLRGPDLGRPEYQLRGCVKEGEGGCWERWRSEGGGRGGEGGRVVRVTSLLHGPDLGRPEYQVRGCVKEGGWERSRCEG